MRYVLLAVALSACIEGPMGPAGPQGQQGNSGPQGRDGVSGVALVDMVLCQGTITLGGKAYPVDHSAYVFSDNSVMATCSAGNGLIEAFGVTMFRADQGGNIAAACQFALDVDAASYGWFSFDMISQRTSTVVSYHDRGSAYDGATTAIGCERL